MTNSPKIPVVPILRIASKVRVFRLLSEAAAAVSAAARKKLPDQKRGRLFLLQQKSAFTGSLLTGQRQILTAFRLLVIAGMPAHPFNL